MRRTLEATKHAKAAVLSRWSRSLLFRTVTSAVLLTALALLAAGGFLSNQIAAGLFQERFHQVESESVRGLNQVKAIFDSAATTDRASTHSLVTNTLKILEGDGALVPRDFVLVPLPGDDTLYVGPTASGNLTSRIVPEALAAQIRESNAIYWQSIEVKKGAGTGPGLIFGTRVTLPPGKEYGLYLVYDLTSVQNTLDFINRAMALVGGLLLLVVGGITWYVTRGVVRPVADAAQVSEKLPPASSRNAWRSRARTRSRAWAPPSTTWPSPCRTRSTSWRPSRRCSSASSPTSPTSCAPR